MKIIDYTNQIQKEAILNECKGNLFEFLVAQGLSAKSSLEDQFLLNLPTDFKARLSGYEELMRTHEPKLLVELPKLARETVATIWENKTVKNLTFDQWSVIGKMVALNDNEYWNETDIVGSFKDKNGENKNLAFSLKLTKDHSFTNTKSAGVKSFLVKYFSFYQKELIEKMQKELNSEVDESFLQMGHRLYSLIDLEWKGSFSSEWSETQTELPGELPEEMRSIVHENYHRVALKIYDLLRTLKEKDNKYFFNSLAALCGFGHPDIIQVNCFHQDYQIKSIKLHTFEDFFSSANQECVIHDLKVGAISVEISLGNVSLQIRVKPMNKFTTAAYKINCSIKVRESISKEGKGNS